MPFRILDPCKREMAEASTTFLLKQFEKFVSETLELRGSIEERINELKREHELIKKVLECADALREQFTCLWIQQLRDIGNEIEYVVGLHNHKDAHKTAGPWYSISKVRTRSIAEEIKKIEKKLKSIKGNRSEYSISLSSHPASTSAENQAGIAPLHTPEMEILGVEGPRKELASWVLDVEQAYRAMFVVGMGGSGKTALVKLVYEQLKTDFDCHVWLIASEYEHTKELLSTMYNKLRKQTGQTSSTSSQDIIGMLKNYLRDKRYLIVLDNWNRKDWESVKYAFPTDKNSRVIVTTRRGDVASSCRDTSVDIYKIPPLPFEKAQELFCRRAFPEIGTYPSVPDLREVCERLLIRCEGLPLGIIEIGKHLSHKERNVSIFKKLESSLQDELKRELSSIPQVLLSSYNDLPYHLKCCFLEELMERNLVQASELEIDGRPRTCRLHNLMHKIVLSKSKDENFCAVNGDIFEQMQRLSIQNSEYNEPDKVLLHHVHTFFSSSLHMRIPPGIIPSMLLLKILHLDHALLEALPRGIKMLLLLKYLSVRNTGIKQVPISTGRLKLLETLNLKGTFVTQLPDTLLSLGNLRHLLAGRRSVNGREAFDAVQGIKVPKGIGKLTNLQKLSFISADRDHKLIQELGNLKRLRKLGIVDLPSDSGPFLRETIQKLTSLHSLSLTSQEMNEVLKIQEINNPPHLQRLYLWGRLERMPRWISKLHKLVRIRLKWSRLAAADNPIPILGKLNNLLELQLLNAYTGNQLNFCAGTFLKLKILEFNQMEGLQVIMIGNGALPCLEKLSISLCQNLREIPYITQLKELHLTDMPQDAVSPFKRDGPLYRHVQHVNINSWCLQNHVWFLEDMS